MTDAEKSAEKARLQDLLDASKRAGSGYGERIARIEKRMAELG